jgi:hypothetical protein
MHAYIHTYTHTHACIHKHTYMYTRIHIHAHACIHTYTYIHTHTYMHTYTHIHINTQTYIHTHSKHKCMYHENKCISTLRVSVRTNVARTSRSSDRVSYAKQQMCEIFYWRWRRRGNSTTHMKNGIASLASNSLRIRAQHEGTEQVRGIR